MERKMFDTPVLPRLETVLSEVETGDLIIPEFQRPFVWHVDQRLRLLDSIVQGMPIGSLLVWRSRERELKTYTELGGHKLIPPKKDSGKFNYLLDGHQRLSTLFGALSPKAKNFSKEWTAFYELGSEDQPQFRPFTKGPIPDNWLPLSLLLDGDALFDFTQNLRNNGQRDHAKEAERLANIVRDYIIPVVPLVTEELDTVTDAFVRINSQGSNMSEAHMLRALTYLSQIDTERGFERVRGLLDSGWDVMPDQVLVNSLKAQLGLNIYSAGVRKVRDSLDGNPEILDRLGESLTEATAALSRVGLRGFAAVPYAYQLVALAAVAARQPGKVATEQYDCAIRSWIWVTTYTERFTGSTGAQIRDEIQRLEMTLFGESEQAESHVIGPLEKVRGGTVRTRAFLLFLANMVQDPEARERRQNLLIMGSPGVQRLFRGVPRTDPGNILIATVEEARGLRACIEAQTLSPAKADEFGIPLHALPFSTEEQFVLERREHLQKEEAAFVTDFGLQILSDDDF